MFLRSRRLGEVRVGIEREAVVEFLGPPDEVIDCGDGDSMDCYAERRLQIGYYEGLVTYIGIKWSHYPPWPDGGPRLSGSCSLVDDLPSEIKGSVDAFIDWLASSSFRMQTYSDDCVSIDVENGARANFDGGQLSSLCT